MDLFNELCLLIVGTVGIYSSGEAPYNLQSLCKLQSLDVGEIDNGIIDDDTERVEEIGRLYIDTLIKSLPTQLSKGLKTICDKEIRVFKTLCSSVYSSRQRPDVAVLLNEVEVMLIIEIESCSSPSSFPNTIRKTILGLIDTIRHFKRYGLHSTSEWSGFTFPKFLKCESVVKVTVKFDLHTFKFWYNLTCINQDRVWGTVRDVLRDNIAQFKKMRNTNNIS